jgi:hypothetical protein
MKLLLTSIGLVLIVALSVSENKKHYSALEEAISKNQGFVAYKSRVDNIRKEYK